MKFVENSRALGLFRRTFLHRMTKPRRLRPPAPSWSPSLPTLALLAFAVVVTGVATPRAARATEVGGSRRFGLGLAVGTATSLVGKYFIDPGHAFDFGLSFWHWRHGCWHDERGVLHCDNYGDTYNHGGFGLNADYLWEDRLVQNRARLDWHIGVGGRFWHWDDDYYGVDRRSAVAVRMPVGLDLTFVRPSFLELYLELVPSLYVAPFTDFDAEAFLGVRFYF